MQRIQQLGLRHGRGARLADRDAGGDVGQHRGLRQRRAGRQRDGEGRDQRVTGAGDVGDLTRARREMHRRFAAANQGQAFDRALDQHRLAAGGLQSHAAGAIGLGIECGVDMGGGADLELVRGQHGYSAIGAEIRPFRVDDDRFAMGCDQVQQLVEHRVAEHAFGIIRQNDDIGTWQRRFDAPEQRRPPWPYPVPQSSPHPGAATAGRRR